MEKLLLYIKHHLRFLWTIIDKINQAFFGILWQNRMDQAFCAVIGRINDVNYTFRKLNYNDASSLVSIIGSQNPDDLRFFKPHGFDLDSINRQMKNKAFLMMGAFDGDLLVGYFFLRFFANRKCFVGRLIDTKYRGKGIGITMNKIMYEISWEMNFRCLSTISKHNSLVIAAHARNQIMVIRKQLQNDYLLVEFLKSHQ